MSSEEEYKKISEDSHFSKDKYYADILREYDIASSQREKRLDLLKEIEKTGSSATKRVGVISFIADETGLHSHISPRDIPAFGSALLCVGQVNTLRIILNSPGGDGNTAEKIVDMCRNYCKKMELIIPNMAKSAATIVALGSDEIIMGYCSEIGPIDAQVPIVIDGIPRFISAQSFINAKQSLIKEFEEASSQNKDTKAILQQIASLNIPFTEQCKKYMEFSRDIVKKFLEKYMFKKYKNNRSLLTQKIDEVLKHLSSTETFIVHGRMINGQMAKSKLGLNVKQLGKDDIYWKKIWEYYVRADIGLGGRMGVPRASKMIETKTETLLAS